MYLTQFEHRIKFVCGSKMFVVGDPLDRAHVIPSQHYASRSSGLRTTDNVEPVELWQDRPDLDAVIVDAAGIVRLLEGLVRLTAAHVPASWASAITCLMGA